MRLLAIVVLLLAWPSVVSAQALTCHQFLDVYQLGETGERALNFYVIGLSEGLQIAQQTIELLESEVGSDTAARVAALGIEATVRPIFGLSSREIVTRLALRCGRLENDASVLDAFYQVSVELRAAP